MWRQLIRSLWILTILGVVVGSLLPAGGPVMTQVARLHVSDKILHFSAYAVLSIIPALAFQRRRSVLLTAAALVVLGLALEFAQHIVPGRSTDMRDELANTAGVAAGILVACPLRPRRGQPPGSPS